MKIMDNKSDKNELSMRKINKFFKENEWSLGLVVLAIVALTFDIIGFKMMFEENSLKGYMRDYIYLSMRLFLLEISTPNIDTPIPWTLEVGRWLSAIATIWAVMLTVAHVFKDKLALIWKGNGHIVIIGAGSKGKALGLDWMSKAKNDNSHKDYGKLFVFIEKDKSNTNADLLKSKGAVIIYGDAKDEEVLEKAKIQKAKYVVIMTNCDSTNMEVISSVSSLTKPKEKNTEEKKSEDRILCYVHITHNEFYDFFMAKDFKKENSKIDVKIFNANSNAAHLLFGENNLIGSNVFTDVNTIKDKTKKVKIAILGFGKLGENILVHALHLGHFYNEVPIEITVVYDTDKDENANTLDEFIKQYDIGIEKEARRNTQFNDYWNIEFIDDGDFVNKDISEYSQIIVAYENEFESLSNLMKMLKKFNNEILSNKIDISLYSNSFAHTAGVMDRDKDNTENTVFKQVRTFGQIDKTCSYDIVINEELDRKAKLNNKQYNDLHGYGNPALNADAQWQDLNMFTEDSNRYLIEHNKIKKYIIDKIIAQSTIRNDYQNLRDTFSKKYFNHEGMKPINWDNMALQEHDYAIKLSEEDIIQLAKVEHKRWNAFHILNGWKLMSLEQLKNATSGLSGHKAKKNKQKDKNKKLHACIVNWDQLDHVSDIMEHNYKSDDIETIMRIPSLESLASKQIIINI